LLVINFIYFLHFSKVISTTYCAQNIQMFVIKCIYIKFLDYIATPLNFLFKELLIVFFLRFPRAIDTFKTLR